MACRPFFSDTNRIDGAEPGAQKSANPVRHRATFISWASIEKTLAEKSADAATILAFFLDILRASRMMTHPASVIVSPTCIHVIEHPPAARRT